MSKLEQLIAELCPDEVERVKLKDVCIDFIVPMRDRPKEFNGNIPWCRIEDKEGQYFNKSLTNLGVTEEIVKKMNLKIFPTGTVICSCSASIGVYAINTQPLITNQTFIGLVCGDKIYNKYLLYLMETLTSELVRLSTTGTIPYISRAKFENFEIPLPPLPVQEEIVRILDTFTELTTKLTTELTMRKQQYEYYRDSLLIHNKFSERVLLKSVVKKGCSGGTPRKGEEKFYLNGTVPWLRTQDVKFNEIFEINSFITEEAVKKTSAKWIPANCVIVAISGATAGRCAINKIPTTTNQHCYNMEIDETKAIYKYIYYCVCSQYEELLSRKQGARGDLNSSLILGISIPLPSLEEQQRIVDILDRFDTLCNDISQGLPAEIKMRQQQYEYYRNKLLIFEKAKV